MLHEDDVTRIEFTDDVQMSAAYPDSGETSRRPPRPDPTTRIRTVDNQQAEVRPQALDDTTPRLLIIAKAMRQKDHRPCSAPTILMLFLAYTSTALA